jgi:hypothetical protein
VATEEKSEDLIENDPFNIDWECQKCGSTISAWIDMDEVVADTPGVEGRPGPYCEQCGERDTYFPNKVQVSLLEIFGRAVQVLARRLHDMEPE